MKKNLFARAQGPFYDRWEHTPTEQREFAIRQALAQYIQFAKTQSPFYRERLQAFSENATHPLAHIPLLLSSDLRQNLPPQGSQLLTSQEVGPTVFQSGGTTGTPKTSLFTTEELDLLDFSNARGFYALGLQPQDRAANLWAVGGLYMTFIHMNRMLQQYGCMNFPFSNQTPVDFVHQVAQLFRINCFTGISSVVLNTLREIHQLGSGNLKIDKIFYGGEHFYESDKTEIREKFGTTTIAAPGYGTVDSWYIGYQCLKTPTGVFHAHDDQAYIEILDEHSLQPMPMGEIGSLVVTTFPRRLTPIIRYNVGDRAQWLKEPCPCGRTTPLFRLLGRGDNILRIGYDSIDYNDIQKIIARHPELSGTLQMQKIRLEGRDQLILRIETDLSLEHHQKIRELLNQEILDDRPSLREFIKKKTVAPLAIELVPLRSLKLNPRTGKLIRVIDVL